MLPLLGHGLEMFQEGTPHQRTKACEYPSWVIHGIVNALILNFNK